MELLKYVILGFLQGFTEPLPISSSGHVFILKKILNKFNCGAKTIIVPQFTLYHRISQITSQNTAEL